MGYPDNLRIIRIVIILILFLGILSCKKNHPPVIQGITCTPESKSAGTLFTLKADASDEDGDALQYFWSADGGLFRDSVNKAQTTWRSPVDGSGETYSLKVTVSDGEQETSLEYVIALTAPVFGKVSGYAWFLNCSVPVSGLTIELDGQKTLTDTKGRFRFDNIPVGEYNLTGAKEDFVPVTRTVTVISNSDVIVYLSLASAMYTSNLHGYVRDQDSLPLGDVKVVMLNPDGSESKLSTYTNSAGHYQLWNIPVGLRKITVRKATDNNFGFEEATVEMYVTGPESQLDVSINIINLTGRFYDSRDKHYYNYRLIGTQTWMAENLAYLPEVDPPSTGSDDSRHFYVSGYEGTDVSEAKRQANYATYGVLYNYPAAMVVCPPGWHLPSDNEWKVLENFLGANAGFHLKSKTGWTNQGNGDNSSGFMALPGGDRLENLGFTGPGSEAHFWSTGLATGEGAWTRALLYSDHEFYRFAEVRRSGYSVRCLKD